MHLKSYTLTGSDPFNRDLGEKIGLDSPIRRWDDDLMLFFPESLRTVAAFFLLLPFLCNLSAEAGALLRPIGEVDMPLGADDAGNRKQIYLDPLLADAFQEMGFDFLVVHVWRNALEQAGLEVVNGLNQWAGRTGCGYIINLENTVRPRGKHPDFRRPGFFFQPTEEWLSRCLDSPHFMGVCYDEAEHWLTNGVDVTGGAHAVEAFRPHFVDAGGMTLEEAYENALHNLILLREAQFGFAHASWGTLLRPMIRSEHVFPILYPLFARAGVAPHPKFLKETVLPVSAAAALGACRQYGVPYVPCLDLWGPRGPEAARKEWPYHTPEELRSALLFSYWTGAHAAYIENINYRDSLYREVEGKPELTEWGEAAKAFRCDYMPNHPRSVRAEEFRPRIVIVRFPDSDWGQVGRHQIRENLYGASNLKPTPVTREWIRIWHILTHGTMPDTGLTWHADGFRMPFRLFFPANSVALYDHLACDPRLYEDVELVFLVGVTVAQSTLKTLRAYVASGGTVASIPALAPERIRKRHRKGTTILEKRKGRWILFEDTEDEAFLEAVKPFLGESQELRYTFTDKEVVFTAPEHLGRLQVEVRAR